MSGEVKERQKLMTIKEFIWKTIFSLDVLHPKTSKKLKKFLFIEWNEKGFAKKFIVF